MMNNFEYNTKQIDTMMNIINDPEYEDKDVKLLIIINLLADNAISQEKTFELLEQNKIFSDYWIRIALRSTDIFRMKYLCESE